MIVSTSEIIKNIILSQKLNKNDYVKFICQQEKVYLMCRRINII